jgi:hypothetical protein
MKSPTDSAASMRDDSPRAPRQTGQFNGYNQSERIAETIITIVARTTNVIATLKCLSLLRLSE